MTDSGSTPSMRKGIALAAILAAQLMMVLDTSIVTTALPVMQGTFGFTTSGLAWVQSAYALAFGGLLLLGARAGDLLGRRRVFLAGVALFTLASAAAGAAQTGEWLLAARAVQGIAAAFAIPSTLALLIVTFPQPGERTRAIAMYSAVIGAGGSVGIVVGGVFTDLLSWRYGLFVNIPIGLLILLIAPRVLAETARKQGRFDLGGALSSTLGMSALVFGLMELAQAGNTAVALVSLVAAVVILSLFVLIERRAVNPIVPLRLFHSASRTGAYITRVLIVGAMFSTFYFLSQYLQNVLGFTPLEAGLAYVPITGMFFAMVYVVPILARRISRAPLLLASLIVALIGMVALSRISADTPYFPLVVIPLLILGVGQGIAIILLTDLGMADVDPGDAGAASGLVNTAHQLGGTVGLAVLSIVFTAALPGSDSRAGKDELANAFSATFTGATIFYILAIVVAVVLVITERRAASVARARPAARVSVTR